jgi:hypothetical protein
MDYNLVFVMDLLLEYLPPLEHSLQPLRGDYRVAEVEVVGQNIVVA